MRQLITSLQNRNAQFKKEIQRYKRKYKDLGTENTKLRKDLEEMEAKLTAAGVKTEKDVKNESASSATEDNEMLDVKNVKDESLGEGSKTIKSEPGDENDSDNEDKSSLTSNEKASIDTTVKKEEGAQTNAAGGAANANASATSIAKLEKENRDLKAQLKKALNDLKDTKVVMDTYKGVSKEQRDKVQLMAAEKKARQEIEEMKAQLKKIQETKREDRKDRRVDEDMMRKIKQLEEKNCELQKQMAAQKVIDGNYGYRPFVGSNVSLMNLFKIFLY